MWCSMSVSYALIDSTGTKVVGFPFIACGVLAFCDGHCCHSHIWRYDSLEKRLIEERRVARRFEDPFWIFESPQPTRITRLMSSSTHRFMAQSIRARRRGGKSRFGMHRRTCTRKYDPTFQNHCGFVCLLKAAGTCVSRNNIRDLRAHTADLVYKAFIGGQCCME